MMNRAPNSRQAAAGEYDVIIIGGGIYGITLALEAGRRGLKSLMLEKGDFGEYTSFNSLKIIHGGLRYLQSLDLHRFKESVRERSWFLKHFPRQVYPLPCLMPLYGKGLKRPLVFRAALLVNHLLSLDRNEGLASDHRLPRGGIVGVAKSKAIFPLLDTDGLKGSALWYDAAMPNSQLLVMELLRLATETGTTAQNYSPVRSLLTDTHGRIKGVMALDRESGALHEYRAATVINSTGPWSRKVIAGILGDREELFRPSLAWNVAFNRPALSDHALAVQARTPGSKLYFVTPWKGRIFAGCGHEPWLRGPDRPMPTLRQLEQFIGELNRAMPGTNLKVDEISRVFAGLLPAAEAGTSILTKREVIIDHGAAGGPQGLYSVGGIKFTTARLVAEKIWGMIGGKNPTLSAAPAAMPIQEGIVYPQSGKETEQLVAVQKIDKTVHHLDDLVLRRSTLWENGPRVALAELAEMLAWDEDRRQKELEGCTARLQPLALEPPPQSPRKHNLP
jgi:glycerol-3-phosphate dehydrogenase